MSKAWWRRGNLSSLGCLAPLPLVERWRKSPHCDELKAQRPRGVVLVTKDPIRNSRGLLLRLHAQGLRHAVEVRRSRPGSCLQDRRLHEFVEDVLNAGGRSLRPEHIFVYRCVDLLGDSKRDIEEAASRISWAAGDTELMGAIPAAFEDLIPVTDQLSKALSLPLLGNDPATSQLRVDKFQMQQAVDRHCGAGARQVLAATAEEAVSQRQEAGLRYPVVAKPVNSGASDGLFLCKDDAELGFAVRANVGKKGVFQQDKHAMVIQEFFEGEEFVVNTVSLNGCHSVQDMWQAEKIVEGTEIFYGHQVLVPDVGAHDDVLKFAFQVLDAVGLSGGAAHLELVRTPTGVRLIEVNPRTAGHCPRATEFVGGKDQYSDLALAIMQPDRFLDEVSKNPAYSCDPSGQTVMAVFLRAPSNAEVCKEELLRIVDLPTFRCFDRVDTPLFEEAVQMAPTGAFWLASRTEDLFTVPLTVLLSGCGEDLRRDLEKIRELERDSLYQLFGTSDPSFCAGALTGGNFQAWQTAILASRKSGAALQSAGTKSAATPASERDE